jgi:hypothetical protein
MRNANATQNRFMRLALYVHQRQHGASVVVRRKVKVEANPATGETHWQIRQWRVPRVCVLTQKTQREVKFNAGAMTANRSIVQGSSLDTGIRHFLFDRRLVPADLVLTVDDWIVFHDRHYDIKDITEYEYDTGWLVTAKELKGRVERAEVILLDAADRLVLDSASDATK